MSRFRKTTYIQSRESDSPVWRLVLLFYRVFYKNTATVTHYWSLVLILSDAYNIYYFVFIYISKRFLETHKNHQDDDGAGNRRRDSRGKIVSFVGILILPIDYETTIVREIDTNEITTKTRTFKLVTHHVGLQRSSRNIIYSATSHGCCSENRRVERGRSKKAFPGSKPQYDIPGVVTDKRVTDRTVYYEKQYGEQKKE